MHNNRHKLKNLIYILFLTLFISCSERVELSLENDEKLQIECVIVPGKEITATLSTVSNFSDIQNIVYPENAIIYLRTGTDASFSFKYDKDREIYFIPTNHHTPNLTYKYEIRAYLKDNIENELIGNTKFHTTSLIKMNEGTTQIEKEGSSLTLYSKFSFVQKNSNPYMNLHTYFKEVDSDNNLSELQPLDFIGNDEDPLAFYNSEYTNGTYINIERVDYTDFSMSFRFPENIESESQVSDYIYFYNNAVSESVYRYDIARAKHVSAIVGGISDPVVTYTNIDNGYGVFGSSIGRLDSIKFK